MGGFAASPVDEEWEPELDTALKEAHAEALFNRVAGLCPGGRLPAKCWCGEGPRWTLGDGVEIRPSVILELDQELSREMLSELLDKCRPESCQCGRYSIFMDEEEVDEERAAFACADGSVPMRI